MKLLEIETWIHSRIRLMHIWLSLCVKEKRSLDVTAHRRLSSRRNLFSDWQQQTLSHKEFFCAERRSDVAADDASSTLLLLLLLRAAVTARNQELWVFSASAAAFRAPRNQNHPSQWTVVPAVNGARGTSRHTGLIYDPPQRRSVYRHNQRARSERDSLFTNSVKKDGRTQCSSSSSPPLLLLLLFSSSFPPSLFSSPPPPCFPTFFLLLSSLFSPPFSSSPPPSPSSTLLFLFLSFFF